MAWLERILDFIKSFFSWDQSRAQERTQLSNEKVESFAVTQATQAEQADRQMLDAQTNGISTSEELLQRVKDHDA